MPNIGKENKVRRVDHIVNTKWRSQIQELDSTGIPINKTVINLLKMYESEQVRNAIACSIKEEGFRQKSRILR